MKPKIQPVQQYTTPNTLTRVASLRVKWKRRTISTDKPTDHSSRQCESKLSGHFSWEKDYWSLILTANLPQIWLLFRSSDRFEWRKLLLALSTDFTTCSTTKRLDRRISQDSASSFDSTVDAQIERQLVGCRKSLPTKNHLNESRCNCHYPDLITGNIVRQKQ